jgi:hypothetical protein
MWTISVVFRYVAKIRAVPLFDTVVVVVVVVVGGDGMFFSFM